MIENINKITRVEVTESHSGIPLLGWESVSNALNTFSTGKSRSSKVTRNDLERNAIQKGGPIGLFLVMATTEDRSSFVERMLQEAKAGVDSRGRWERHYDYDGQGVFHKTSVGVQRLPELKDGYLLELNAAYVGKEVEDGLAETLGIEQGLQWKSVEVGLTPEGNQFKIDFTQVVYRLQSVTTGLTQPKGRQRISGLDVANYFMSTNEWAEPATNYVLGLQDEIEVTLNLGRVASRFEYSHGKIAADNWRQEKSVISGHLEKDYEDKTKFISPSLVVLMKRFSKERYDRLPIIDPKMKATVNSLAERVADTFRPAGES